MRIKLADGRLPSNYLELLFSLLVRRLRLLWWKPSSHLEALSCAPQGIVPVVIVLTNEEAAHLGSWTVDGSKHGDVPALSARSLAVYYHPVFRVKRFIVRFNLLWVDFVHRKHIYIYIYIIPDFSIPIFRHIRVEFSTCILPCMHRVTITNKRHERKVLRENFPGECWWKHPTDTCWD